MNEDLNLSEFGEQCIKLWEEGSLEPKLVAYDDGGGTWTISWGCTVGVYKGMKITADEAEAMFQKEIAKHVALVKSHVKTKLTQYQFDAAVSFVFNEGVPSGWVNAVNAKTYEEAVPTTLMKYVYVKGKRWPGLVTRRSDELQLWHGVYEDARMTVPCPYVIANNNDIAYADPAKRDLSHKVTATASVAATVATKVAADAVTSSATPAAHSAADAALPTVTDLDKMVTTGQHVRTLTDQVGDLSTWLWHSQAAPFALAAILAAIVYVFIEGGIGTSSKGASSDSAS